MTLAWIDLETTGLNYEQDIPLEVGIILMENNGMREIARRNWIVAIKYYDSKPVDDFVIGMHTANGLLLEIATTMKVYSGWAELDDEICTWLESFTFEQLTPAGSSIHFDLDFIRKRFPRFYNHLHHRVLDVSSIKLIYTLVGENYDKGPQDPHRALGDLDNDILWLKNFLSHTAHLFPVTKETDGTSS